MMKKIILFVLTVLVSVTSAMAQKVVKGVVQDQYGDPLPGVAVVVKGTNNGTTTNTAGVFEIRVKNPQTDVLEFNSLGYKSIDVSIDGRQSLDITLDEESSMLDDVVVIGYGTARRGDLTGAISSVSSKAIEGMPVASAAETLSGRMPGVQITSADGSPDAEILVRVRGGGSITQDNSPLFLVDGFQVDDIKDIPPIDIESIVVLKDASATAVYGARGANGVILLTTKSAKDGRVNISFNGYAQLRTLPKQLPVFDPYEFVMMQYESARLGSSEPTSFYEKYGDLDELYIYKGYKGDNWQDEIFGQTAVTQNYNLSISGATEKHKYSVSATYLNAPSILAGNGQSRFTTNFKLSSQLSDNLVFEYNTRFMDNRIDGRGTEGVSILEALEYAPTQGLQDFMASPNVSEEIAPEDEEFVQRYNPLEKVQQNWRRRNNTLFNTNVALNWNITDGLVYRAEFGIDYGYNQAKQYYGSKTNQAISYSDGMPMTEWTKGESSKYRFAQTLTYNFTLAKKHKFNVMVGQELTHSQTRSTTTSARYFPLGIEPQAAYDNQGMGTPYQHTSNTSTPDRIASFFGRINYNYRNRYMLTFTMRADGSTKFAPGRQWGFFPAGAFAWRISEEDFLKNNPVISNLKLRLSYGATGNNRIDSDMWRNVYKVSQSKAPGWNEVTNSYYEPGSTYLTNPMLKWETTYTRNIGLDYGFFKERLFGSAELYWNTTQDLLVPSAIPGSTGFTQQLTNVGQTSNRGLEFQITGLIVKKRDFTLSATANVSFNKNRVDKLASGEEVWELMSRWASTDQLPNNDYRMIVGRETGLMYGYVNDGFYSVDDFDYDAYLTTRKWVLREGVVDASSLVNLRPGAPKFKKFGPVEEGDLNPLINEDDIVEIGNTNPKMIGGFGLDATFKGFDLNLFFNFMYGHKVYNGNKMHLTSWWRNNSRGNLSTSVDSQHRFRYFDDDGNDLRVDPDLLREFNKNATIWNPTTLGTAVMMSDNAEDGSFLRLNTATLGYTLPQKASQRIGIRTLRFYVTGGNLFCLTSYTGFDPEVNIQRGMTPNIDCNVYPRSRTYTIGMNVTF